MRRVLAMVVFSMATCLVNAEEVKMEVVSYGGWPNCVRVANQEIELIVTTDVGPRIIRFGYVGGQNLLGEDKAALGKVGGDEFRSYGGHRFWHAPEAMPRTYYPDNERVEYRWDKKTLTLVPPLEKSNGIQKEIDITLAPDANRVDVVHRLTNKNAWAIEVAPWALTVMAKNGRAVVPQEPYKPHPEYLLPARPIVLWHYTDMSDPRFVWGPKYIQMKQDPSAKTKQKIGVRSTLGWAAYALNGEVFVKRYSGDVSGEFPDFGCNTECYFDPDILEIETLGPLTSVEPDGVIAHAERWYMFKETVGETEDAVDTKLLPLVRKTDGL